MCTKEFFLSRLGKYSAIDIKNYKLSDKKNSKNALEIKDGTLVKRKRNSVIVRENLLIVIFLENQFLDLIFFA